MKIPMATNRLSHIDYRRSQNRSNSGMLEPTTAPVAVKAVLFALAAVVSACLTLILFTKCPIKNQLLLFGWTIGHGALLIGVFYRTKEHPPINRYLTLLSLYLLVAFPLKATLSQIPWLAEIVPGYALRPDLFDVSLIPAIAYTFGVAIAILIVMSLPYLGKPVKNSLVPGKFRYSRFIWVVIISLIVKAIAHYVLIWGVPNRPPQNVIPLVTGATKMYVTLGIFHLLNVAAAHIVISGGTVVQKSVVGVLAIIFVAMDWGIGSKYSTVYTLVMVVSTATIISYKIKTKRRPWILVVVCLLVAVMAYPVIHNYRFARRSAPNADLVDLISKSVELTVMKQEKQEEASLFVSSFLKIVQRINGFQNHASAVLHQSKLGFEARDLISSSAISSRYTTVVTGIEHESNTFGITQSGMAAGLFRLEPLQVFCYSLTMNTIFLWSLLHYTRKICKRYENWLASGVSFGLFIVFMQFHGGNFLFIGKQLITLFFAAWLANTFITKKPQKRQWVMAPGYSANQNSAHRPMNEIHS